MNKNFTTLPDQRLRQTSDEIIAFDKSVADLIRDLIEVSQIQTDPQALGMAAVQIGVLKRVFVGRIRNKFKPFVNARIIKASKKQAPLLEGCFSVKGIYGQVMRPAEVTIEAQDKNGKKMIKSYKGLAAKIVQHEIDHQNGILFVDHVHNQNGKLFRVEKDKEGKEQLVEISVT